MIKKNTFQEQLGHILDISKLLLYPAVGTGEALPFLMYPYQYGINNMMDNLNSNLGYDFREILGY
jgi:hypothetical protein